MTTPLFLLEWLAAPLSGAVNHYIEPAVYWHARMMVLAWGVCLPLGALVARYFKVTPQQDWPTVLDNKAWWHGHRLLQYGGVLAMTVGLVLVWSYPGQSSVAVWLHALLGWAVLVAGWLQMLGGIARGSKGGPTDAQMRGDHYDMTAWRRAFEQIHKRLGWAAIAMAVPTTVIGLVIADAPRWMLLVLVLWWLGLALLAFALQRRGFCMDTYQAIWGTNSSMPGLQRPATGWGVKRHGSNPWKTQPLTSFIPND